MDFFTQRIISATAALGAFAAKLISPSDDPSVYIRSFGDAITETSRAVYLLNPVLGTMGQVVGGAISSLAGFMQALDGMVDRYSRFSPELAMAKAEADVTQILGDMRRAQEASPSLIRYVQQRSDMQQQFEEAKIKFMTKLMPVALGLMEIARALLPLVSTIVDNINPSEAIEKGLSPIKGLAESLVKKMFDDDVRDNANDALAAVRQGYVDPGSERERELLKKGTPFIKVPRV